MSAWLGVLLLAGVTSQFFFEYLCTQFCREAIINCFKWRFKKINHYTTGSSPIYAWLAGVGHFERSDLRIELRMKCREKLILFWSRIA
jgi:hypothetical protein